MSYQEETNSLLVATIYFTTDLKKKHCACVWILSDVDYTDAGDDEKEVDYHNGCYFFG